VDFEVGDGGCRVCVVWEVSGGVFEVDGSREISAVMWVAVAGWLTGQ
jgi:hypothetical protein